MANRTEEEGTVTNFISLSSKITVDSECSFEIKRHLFLERKAMTNLDSILISKDITLLTKVLIVNGMVFPDSSVQLSHSVMSKSLRPHESQHARPPCPSPTPGVHQTHVHWVSDAFQPSHPLSSPSPAFNLSQHQSLFQWVNSSHEVTKVLEFQL